MSPAQTASAFVGRARELQSMRDALEEARTGSPRTVLLGGEAGIGKSRVVSEFTLKLSDDVLVVKGQCVDLDADAPPYGPLAAVLRQLVAAMGVDAIGAAAGPNSEALGILMHEFAGKHEADASVDEFGQAGRRMLYAAIASVVESVAAEKSIVIVIEDAHWADQATLHVLRYLMRVVETGRIFIVITFRSDELPHGHPLRSWLPELDRDRFVVRIELRRFSRTQVRAMMSAAWGDDITRAELDAMYSRSDGVPFFVEELVSSGRESCLVEDFPTTLRGVLLARYDTLSDPAQRLLRVIAAGGTRVEHQLLEAVTSGEPGFEIDDAAREAVAADVIAVDGTAYAFRHALMQEAVHDQLLPGERVRVHSRYAQVLEDRADTSEAGQLSYHWMAAHNLRNAFAASLAAMRSARWAFANETASRMGERAIELWDQVPDAAAIASAPRHELLAETAYLLRNAGESERAVALIDEALDDDTADREQRASMLRNKASFLANLGRPGSIDLLREALECLGDSPPSVMRANVLGELAARLMLDARYADAVETADHAFETAVTVESSQRMSVARNIRGFSRMQRGEIDDGLADLAEAAELAKDSDVSARLRYWVNQSDALFLLGRYEEAVATAEAGVAAARTRGVERTTGAMLISNASGPLYALGHAERASELVTSGLELDAPIGFSAPLQLLAVRLRLSAGDVDGAAELLHRWGPALEGQRRIDRQSDRELACVRAELALEQGEPQRALDQSSILYQNGYRSIPAYDLRLAALDARARAALTAVQKDASLSLDSPRAIVAAASWWPTAALYGAMVDAELSAAEHGEDDPDAWHQVLEHSAGPPAPASAWPYAALRLAEAYAASGDRGAASEWATSAITRAEEIGSGLITARARQLRERAGLRVASVGTQAADRRAGSDTQPTGTGASDELSGLTSRLTTREQQVLELVGQGLSNREIAARLFISAKTASVHVSNILRKTGTSTRTEAAYAARRMG